jgi:hypothetical protein
LIQNSRSEPWKESSASQNHPTRRHLPTFNVGGLCILLVIFSAPSGLAENARPDHFALRLLEIGARQTEFKLRTRLNVAAIDRTAMTEDQILGTGLNSNSLSIGPHETLTLRLTVPRTENSWSAR